MYLHHILNTFHQIGIIALIATALLTILLFIQGDKSEYDYISQTFIRDDSTTKLAKTSLIICIVISILLIFIPKY